LLNQHPLNKPINNILQQLDTYVRVHHALPVACIARQSADAICFAQWKE